MKILFITSFLGGNACGGAEISTRLLLDGLNVNGCEARALTTRKVSESDLISISLPIEPPKRLLVLGNSQVDYLLAREIRKKIYQITPDVIHIQDTYILPATVLANKVLKIPSVITIRNSILDSSWELMFSSPISTMLKRRNQKIVTSLNYVDKIIAVSEYIKTELISRGIAASKVYPIYNLPPKFEVEKIETEGIKNTVTINLFAPGLLANFKGFSVLIQAVLIVSRYENIHLIISGDGPQRNHLIKLTKKLGLQSTVEFTGKLSFDKLSQYYRLCNIVILPSIYPEPFGRVALEALFFGKPIVASRVGGIPEIIEDQKTGLLVPPDNSEKLAEAILVLIRNTSLREAMGKRGREVLETKFNPHRLINQTNRLYTETIALKK